MKSIKEIEKLNKAIKKKEIPLWFILLFMVLLSGIVIQLGIDLINDFVENENKKEGSNGREKKI